jgi:hypothetical protein
MEEISIISLIKEAFEDGYGARATYNDTEMSDREEEWSNVESYYKHKILELD